ncbi:MAG: hypothetical protein UR94_C0005G0017 [Parcubacteria group bacterium GW2011_GWA2_36_10]|nr:MAG: hypothetical protein UR94_C0005G0017 [Parcubacteria group bacterium GW2011_GWA2_36_10]KKT54132.1 MAG: hypothetical protein UW45_C0018G0018 [Parcubacteria group bacterium GW2011_GWC2_44_22]
MPVCYQPKFSNYVKSKRKIKIKKNQEAGR